MANYRNNSYDRGRDNSNYSQNNRSNNGGYARGNGSGGQQRKKHTGCRVAVISKGEYQGKTCVTGWNYSKRDGLVSFLATPYGKSAVHKSQNGREWVNVMVTVRPKMAPSFIVSGLLEVATKKVIIKELGMVMNPKAPHGGYCGKFGGK